MKPAKHVSRKTTLPPHPSPQTGSARLFTIPQSIFEHKYFLVVLLSAYFVLLLAGGYFYRQIGDYGVETDFYGCYIPEAKAFLDGSLTIDEFRGPAYPILLAVTKIFLSDYFLAGVFLSALSAVCVLSLTNRFLQQKFDKVTAHCVLLGMLATPIFLKYSYTAGTDMVFAAFALASVFVLVGSKELTSWRALAAGLLAGCAYLTRYNGSSIFIFAVVFFLFLPQAGNTVTERVRKGGWFLAGFAVLVMPWGSYCLREKGSFFYQKNHLNVAYAIYGSQYKDWDHFWNTATNRFPSMFSVIFADTGKFFQTLLRHFFSHLISDLGFVLKRSNLSKMPGVPLLGLLTLSFGIFSIIGAAAAIRTRLNKLYPLLYFCVFFFIAVLPVFYSSRFSLVLLPFYLLLSVLGIQYIASFIKKVPPSQARLILFSFVWSISMSLALPAVFLDMSSTPKFIVKLHAGIEENNVFFPPETIIVARKPHVAYVFGCQFRQIPYVNSVGELLLALHDMNADYLLISPIEGAMRPSLANALLSKREFPDLEVAAWTEKPYTVLYRYKKTLQMITIGDCNFDTVHIGTEAIAPYSILGSDNSLLIFSVECHNPAFRIIPKDVQVTLKKDERLNFHAGFRPLTPGVYTDTMFINSLSNISPCIVLLKGTGVQ